MSRSFHCQRCGKVFTFHGEDEIILEKVDDATLTRFNVLDMVKACTKCCSNPLVLNGRAFMMYEE